LKEELQLMQSQMNSSRGATSSAECSACEQQRQQAVADSFPGIIAEHGLTREQVERYSRQILLPRFGIDAQAKLCKSSVLIVGCGGLGAPAALYLAAAGKLKSAFIFLSVLTHRQALIV
jgi:adenylyltransferase/sulfurtransferase